MSEEIKRVEFTAEMKKTYKILFPNMLTIHFIILKGVFKGLGYDVELLTTTDRAIVDEGLKSVHNDTCYPALLVIGQFIHALKSGKYDVNKTALLLTQTGGGCRASNYIHLLRKALVKAGFEQVPVISLNPAGLEKNSGFVIDLKTIRRAMAAVAYGDFITALHNQAKAYERKKGTSQALVDKWCAFLSDRLEAGKDASGSAIRFNMKKIAHDFSAIPLDKSLIGKKPKVGIVGEIYVKYAPLANNSLEDFLYSEGCEVNVPGLLGFLLYVFDNNIIDVELYGGKMSKKIANLLLRTYLESYEKMIRKNISDAGFAAPLPHSRVRELGKESVGLGCKMGEGWLLTAEMYALCEEGYDNIICVQPFGCLPNHIVGKGMIRALRRRHPDANIVTVDYDPGATKVNQENRIKLMLSVAREKIEARESGKSSNTGSPVYTRTDENSTRVQGKENVAGRDEDKVLDAR